MSSLTIEPARRVSLREIWPHESRDFSAWLSENLDALSDVVGFELSLVGTEIGAGDFRVDVAAVDESNREIIIENQLERTNHDHLGKLLVYMAAREADAAIWICKEVRQEHADAVSWLNRSHSADFYLLRVEAIRIGSSAAAPIFTIAAGPSQMTRAVSRSRNDMPTDYDAGTLFLQQLLERSSGDPPRSSTIHMSKYIIVPSGRPGIGYHIGALKTKWWVKVQLDHADRDMNKSRFDWLEARSPSIERSLNARLRWERSDETRRSKIFYYGERGVASPTSEWPDIQNEILAAYSTVRRTFDPLLDQAPNS